ncbi:zinc finger protein [Loa loa]|uniref:Zinc finger protein n=1 Tax=Loa loa TaxID=7209 RepID=A0A1S0UHH7_LOALO|nr:zinc finger protein [Loa loa]EJD75152.1 zinc finger protein [Loa loa]
MFEEPQTEPLDLTMSRVCGGRIEPPDASIAEMSGGQEELGETDHEDPTSLNLPIQEASREQTGVGDMPKKVWLRRYQNETSNNQILKRKHPENTTHTGKKRFKCEISKKVVAPPSTHTMNHTSEKPFSCSECNMSFIWPSYLNKHMNIHTGKKPYSCSKCGKNFGHLASLYNHKQIHTGKKPYSCSKCGMNFTRGYEKRRHMKVHGNAKPRFN